MTDSARVGIARAGLARVGSLGVISDSGMGADTTGATVALTIRDFGGRTPSIPFTRNTPAYLPDGTEVGPNAPRLVTVDGRKGLLVEEGATNLVPSNRLKFEGWTAYSGTQVMLTQSVEFPEIGRNDATRIRTTGGTVNLKYYRSIEGSIADQAYTGSVYIKNIGTKPVRFRTQLGPSVTVNPGEWTRAVASGIGNGTTQFQLRFEALNADDDLDFIAWGPQAERKPYPTSFIDGTRAAETLTVPTAGVVSPEEGTIEAAIWVDERVAAITGEASWPAVWHLKYPNGQRSLWIYKARNSARWRLQSYDYISNTSKYIDIPDNLVLPGWRLWSVTWTRQVVRLYLDGALVGTIADPYLPEEAFHPTMDVGFRAGHYLNTTIDTLRISSRARTPEEIQASYEAWQQGRGLERDADTTYLLGFDETRIQVEAELTAKDGGAGGEALPPLSAALSVGDQGLGADALLPLSATLSVGDQGLGADAPTGGRATTFLFDDGTASEHVIREILAVAIFVEDSGTGADVVRKDFILITVYDSGVGTDSTTQIAASVKATDSGTGADAARKDFVLITVYDSGTSTDSIAQITTSVKATDSGTGADAVRKDFILITIYDAGIGTDSIAQVTASMKATDAGTGQDGQRQHGTATVPGAAQGQDVLASIVARTELTDGGFGDDQLAIASRLSVADSGVGGEAVASARIINVADHGGLADHTAYVGLARVGYARVGHLGGGETIAIRSSVATSDYGQGFDDVYSASIVTVLDEGFGGDQLAIQALLTLLDQGFGETTHIDITELTRPPFRAIVVDPRTVPQLKNPKTKAVLWP